MKFGYNQPRVDGRTGVHLVGGKRFLVTVTTDLSYYVMLLSEDDNGVWLAKDGGEYSDLSPKMQETVREFIVNRILMSLDYTKIVYVQVEGYAVRVWFAVDENAP